MRFFPTHGAAVGLLLVLSLGTGPTSAAVSPPSPTSSTAGVAASPGAAVGQSAAAESSASIDARRPFRCPPQRKRNVCRVGYRAHSIVKHFRGRARARQRHQHRTDSTQRPIDDFTPSNSTTIRRNDLRKVMNPRRIKRARSGWSGHRSRERRISTRGADGRLIIYWCRTYWVRTKTYESVIFRDDLWNVKHQARVCYDNYEVLDVVDRFTDFTVFAPTSVDPVAPLVNDDNSEDLPNTSRYVTRYGGKVNNCIFYKGCWPAWYPKVSIQVYPNGDFDWSATSLDG